MGEKKFENPQTVNLHRVLQSALSIQELIRDKDKEEDTAPDPGRVKPVSNISTWGECTVLFKSMLCYVFRMLLCAVKHLRRWTLHSE